MIRYLKCTDNDIEVLSEEKYKLEISLKYKNLNFDNGILTFMTQHSTYIVYYTNIEVKNVDWYVKKMISKDKQNLRHLKFKKLI